MIIILLFIGLFLLAGMGLLPGLVKGIFKATGMIVFYWIIAVVCGLLAGGAVWFLGSMLLGV